MRLSKLFGRTLREVPAEATMVSHQLLLRAGMIRPLAAGIYSYLPLGWRALKKIEGIMRQEMDSIGGQEIRMPSVHPAELWQATGRYEEAGPVMARFPDRTGVGAGDHPRGGGDRLGWAGDQLLPATPLHGLSDPD